MQSSITSTPIPNNIEVTLEVSEGLEALRLDPLMMRRTLDNLVRHSIEAMPDGGCYP
jgi:signal transduction histidine kinase